MSSNEGYSGPLWIEIDRIDPRPASEMRAAVVGEAVEEYAENFEDLPPIRVVADSDDKHWTADGSYRIRAARHLGKKKVQCYVKAGTYLDAFGEASKANKGHGVRITNADKRVRVEAALKIPELAEWSSRRIADHCSVHKNMIEARRPEVALKATCVGKDGKSYPSKRNTPAKSNAPKPEPKPPAQTDPPPIQAPAPDPSLSPADVEIIDGLTDFRDSIKGDEPDPVVFRIPGPPPPAPEAPAEPDWDALLDEQESSIRAFFDLWPEDYRGMVVMMLKSLVSELTPRCPKLVSRSNEVFA